MSGQGVVFNDSTEAEDVAQSCYHNCEGKFIVITGCSVGGMGFETARVLVKYGAEVFMCCPTEEACDNAVRTMRKLQPSAIMLHAHPMNLASFVSIQRCALYINSMNKSIDILINNAGTKESEVKLTEDGFEWQWQVNFLGPFYFTVLLLPLLIQSGTTRKTLQDIAQPARVINISSIMNYVYCSEQGIDFRAIVQDHSKFYKNKNAFRWYSESKLALILFTRELSKRMAFHRTVSIIPGFEPPPVLRPAMSVPVTTPATRVIAMSVHPGIVPGTNNYRHLSMTTIAKLVLKLIVRGKGRPFRRDKHKSISQGASTSVFCALHPSIESGQHYADCAVNGFVHRQALNEAAWEKLWDVAEEQIELRLRMIDQERMTAEKGEL